MIQALDDTLYHLMSTGLTSLGTPPASTQIRFQPPDADWRTYVHGLNRPALNLYLIELRENRRWRSNERARGADPAGGSDVWETPAPGRVDCHYLISAWSKADEDAVPPDQAGTGIEHRILHEVASVLYPLQPLDVTEVWGGIANVPTSFPTDFYVQPLPTVVMPVESFHKYAEFWGTMGSDQPWKPAVYLIVTLPLSVVPRRAGPPVTTVIAEFDLEAPDVLVDFGGRVLDGAGAPAASAWVRVESTPPSPSYVVQTATADSAGHFKFTRLAAGQYLLRAGKSGAGTTTRTVIVPSSTGEYDLQLA